MKFLIDAQLPPALTRLFSENGHTAEHVVTLGLIRATDAALWDYATRQGAVIVTKDEDFSHRSGDGARGPAVLWIRLGNCSNELLTSTIGPLLPTIVEMLEAGETLIEIR